MPPSSNQDREALDSIQQQIWHARLPLEIRLSVSESRLYDKSEPYLISVPRLSYLPFLLSRLLKFYSEELIADIETVSADTGYFTFEGVPLRWHLPVGLLYDIYVLSTQDFNHDSPDGFSSSNSKTDPFRLTVHFSQSSASAQKLNLINPSPAVVHDSFINSVKEADFLRSGTAKPIMSLSAADSKLLWSSTQDNDLSTFSGIHAGLLPSSVPWRNIPLRVYLPSTSSEEMENETEIPAVGREGEAGTKPALSQSQGQIRVIQSQIPPLVAGVAASTAGQLRSPSAGNSTPQTLGTALHSLLPSLFPSRRTPILAKPLLHGVPMPMNAILEEVASKACYADGWVNVVVALTG